MFDVYVPDPPVACIWCGGPVREWQGKDGPCGLYVWAQGRASPVDERGDPEYLIPPESLARQRLPDEFRFYGWCEGGHCTWVIGRTDQAGVWVECDLSMSLEAVEVERDRRAMRDHGYDIPGAKLLDPHWWGPGSLYGD